MFRNLLTKSNFYGYAAVVKTTIDLPEDVLVRAKVVAAERRTTLRELVVEGLKRVTTTPSEAEEAKRRKTLKRLLKEMQASNTEGMTPLKREEIYES